MNLAATIRERAGEGAAILRAALAEKAAALALNAADSKRLQTLSAEIAELEHRLDPENLAAVQLLAAKREQFLRLERKFSDEANARNTAAISKIAAARTEVDAAVIFQSEETAHRERLLDLLEGEFFSRERAVYPVNEMDSSRRLRTLCQIHADFSAEQIADILEKFSAGTPLWKC